MSPTYKPSAWRIVLCKLWVAFFVVLYIRLLTLLGRAARAVELRRVGEAQVFLPMLKSLL